VDERQIESGGFGRRYNFVPNSNKLSSVTVSDKDYNYIYDSNGNIVQETISRHLYQSLLIYAA
jgi:hypothetical protein